MGKEKEDTDTDTDAQLRVLGLKIARSMLKRSKTGDCRIQKYAGSTDSLLLSLISVAELGFENRVFYVIKKVKFIGLKYSK
jgi:hypothetical protein